MNQSLSNTLGANIRAELARSGVKQAQVAEALGISQSNVSARLSGRRPLTVPELYAIAELIGVDPVGLLPSSDSALAASAPVPHAGSVF